MESFGEEKEEEGRTFSLSTPSQVPEHDHEPPPLSPRGFFLLHFFREIGRSGENLFARGRPTPCFPEAGSWRESRKSWACCEQRREE